jgi:hypothetical protein
MKKFYLLILAALVMISSYAFSQSEAKHQKDAARAAKVNTRVDNNGYWKKMAALGLAKLNGITPVKPSVYTGSEIKAFSVLTEDSPDVPTTEVNSTQSENSIFVSPENNELALNSNNSTQNPVGGLYGANYFLTDDGGTTWGGSVEGAGGSNSGDPTTSISLTGRQYVGYIDNAGGQSVSWSDNDGVTWHPVVAATPNGDLLDKNHMWIDNSPVSPYAGNVYVAYTDFGASGYPVEITRTNNQGLSYSTPIDISSGINAGSHSQGVNIQTGPNGEVYVIYAIYDGWPTDETAIGFAKSLDGGATYLPESRIINNIRGIRNTGVNKDMRNNSFPSSACDISNSEFSGNIYVVWANVGVPGVNSGNDVDVYMARSEDQGATWATPVRVNQDPIGLGHKHYFPWITCDPENGILSVVFYDDRNVGSSQCEVYCANSNDGGATWEDFKVSDVAFTPSPIPGLADGYMGDYLGITARGGKVYPVWADNRTGTVMTYCSPYETNPLSKPLGLTANVTFETGITDLEWRFNEAPLFSYFKIYRGVDSVGIATDTVYADQLPDYGIYTYRVTAKYSDGTESSATSASVQWGDAQIAVSPLEIEETLQPDSSVTRTVTISNIGQLEMNYNISMFIPTANTEDVKAYCAASGTCDEYISRVQLNEIDNLSACTQYGDYTDQSTIMSVGSSYTITITNGNPIYPDDQCGVWVDWNQDEVFQDDEAVPVNGTPGVGPYTANITPPAGSVPGTTRLRARITYYQTPMPCDPTTYGEVEDYSVNVQSWLFATPTSGTVQAGENMNIDLTLSAVDMALGDYSAELNVFSNDPDDPEITVPITLHVAEIAVAVEADDNEICLGGTVNITSTMTGGSGSFVYSWTSDPPGFVSTEPNITVSPEVTTTYLLSVQDGAIIVQDQTTVQVDPLPTVALGEDAIICDGDSVTLDAGTGLAGYLWSTGDTTQTITILTAGDYSVTVTNEFGCTANDSYTLGVTLAAEKPVIATGPVTVDNYSSTTSTYTCNNAANATAYAWTVTPAEAGTTSSTGTTADFTWASGYTGAVTVTVIASNDCFTSDVSDGFATTIYSSAGLDENGMAKMLSIYPNPTEGKITLVLPVKNNFTGDLTITDASGAAVYNKTAITVIAGKVDNIDLGNLAKGVYSVKLSNNSTIYTGRVIVK